MFMLQHAQIEFYRTNGYLLVKGLLSKSDAARYREAAHSLIARLSATANLDATWGSAKDISGNQTVIQHCHNVQFYCAAFTVMMTEERFTEAAAQLIGSENVQLHHNKMFIKPPEKGSPFPMHQDYPYFPHERHTMMAAIFHFDDATLEKGCVRVIPGSHLQGPLDHNPEGGWHLPIDQYPLEAAVACPAEAGDVLFFNYLTIHGSGVNVSNEARTTLLIQMRDPEDKPTVKTHESRGQGMMLRGIDPGAVYTGL
jgi:phytanoyl-CoA hydroxylase